MSYRVPFKQDAQDHTQDLPMIPGALTKETMDKYKKDREDFNNITTRRLTSIWMCKMLSITSKWYPGDNAPLHCYDYINQLVCNVKNNNISTNYCISKEYCDYFLITAPYIIKSIIYDELKCHSKLWPASHND